MLNYACDGGGCASRKPCPVCGKEPTATPIENSFYSYAELTEEQKIRFAAYQVFDMPKRASSNIKDTDSGKPEAEEEQARWVMVSERLPNKSGWYLAGLIGWAGGYYTAEVHFDTEIGLPWRSSVRDEVFCWLDGVPELPKPPEAQE